MQAGARGYLLKNALHKELLDTIRAVHGGRKALVLNPVTIPRPSSLVAIWTNNPQLNLNAPAISWPRYEELRGALEKNVRGSQL